MVLQGDGGKRGVGERGMRGGGDRVINTICWVGWNKTPLRKIRGRKGRRRAWQRPSQLQPVPPV